MTTARLRLAAAVDAVAATPMLAGRVLLPDVIEPPAPCSGFTTCTQMPELEIASVAFSQSQAVPGFDTGTYVVTDDAALDVLDAALDHRVPGETTVVGDCDGGRTTRLDVESATYGAFAIVVDTCTDDPLAAELDALVAQWHASGVATPAP